MDRVFGLVPLLDLYSKVTVTHFTKFALDYYPLLVHLFNVNCFGPKPFQFEKTWLCGDGIKEPVKENILIYGYVLYSSFWCFVCRTNSFRFLFGQQVMLCIYGLLLPSVLKPRHTNAMLCSAGCQFSLLQEPNDASFKCPIFIAKIFAFWLFSYGV